jgi:D-alanyl-D-alanine carboxypeptidase
MITEITSQRSGGEMQAGRGLGSRLLTVMATLCAAVGLSHVAQARVMHHSHRHHPNPYASSRPVDPQDEPTPSSNFGPTSPGVSAIVINAASGAELTEEGADTPRYPASLTKLMTLDLAFQALRDRRMTLDTQIPVSLHAASVEPVKLGLMPGDTISVRQAILAMTTMSANDAATALGEYLGGGSEYRCAQMMTLRAHALGMAQTQFYNASGLPNPGQVTTARDLSLLARDLLQNFPQYQPFFEALSFNFNGRTINNNNAMLKFYPGAIGMKTGYTILARHNLITAAERNGTTLIGITLHEDSWRESYVQMASMLDSGFGSHMPGNNAVMLAARQQATPAGVPAGQVPNQLRLAGNAHAPNSYAPPNIPLPKPTGPSLFPVAEAATLHPMVSKRATLGQAKLADNGVTRDLIPGWTAQLGSYSKIRAAKRQAISAHAIRGVGVARIARLRLHGRTLWSAQLAGLSQRDAHETCAAMAARGHRCVVIAPQAAHLAERDTSAG